MEVPIVLGGSTETASFLDRQGESYGWKRLVEEVEPRWRGWVSLGIGEDMIHEALGGPWGMEREII